MVERLGWRSLGIVALLFSAGALLAQRGPSQAEQDRALAAMREYALNYGERLPDYTCIQVTEREHEGIPPFVDLPQDIHGNDPPNRHWSNVIEEEVNLTAGRASYKVLKIDGRPSKLRHGELRSAVGAAEFVTILRRILASDSVANFRWIRNDKLHGRPALVFSFNAPEPSGVTIQDPALGGHEYHVGFTGFVSSDAETSAVMRVALRFTVPKKESPEAAPASEVVGPELLGLDLALDVRLDFKAVNLGGRGLVLPDRFDVQWRRRIPFAGFALTGPNRPGEPPGPEDADTHGQFKECRLASSLIDYSAEQPQGEAHSVLTFGDIPAPPAPTK